MSTRQPCPKDNHSDSSVFSATESGALEPGRRTFGRAAGLDLGGRTRPGAIERRTVIHGSVPVEREGSKPGSWVPRGRRNALGRWVQGKGNLPRVVQRQDVDHGVSQGSTEAPPEVVMKRPNVSTVRDRLNADAAPSGRGMQRGAQRPLAEKVRHCRTLLAHCAKRIVLVVGTSAFEARKPDVIYPSGAIVHASRAIRRDESKHWPMAKKTSSRSPTQSKSGGNVERSQYSPELEESLRVLKSLAARINFLSSEGLATYGGSHLEDRATIFRAQLDLIRQQLEADPSLRAEFERHALMQECRHIFGVSRNNQEVAAEIAAEVTAKWSDRKKPPHKGKPWALGPELWILHFYKRWYEQARLRLVHLNHDPQLREAYRSTISSHPERNLHLNAKTDELAERKTLVQAWSPIKGAAKKEESRRTSGRTISGQTRRQKPV